MASAEPELEPVPSPEPEPVAIPEPEPMPEPTILSTSLPSLEPKSPFGWVAFASTTAGYRLVHLSGAIPMVGDTVEVPDVGELVVLRLGRSPLPGDQRTCVFLEQLVRSEASLVG